MTYSYLLHPEADKEYTEAFIWYQKQQEGLGEKFIEAVRQKLEAIAVSPETFGSKGNKNYREAKVEIFPYVIVYKIYKLKNLVFVSSIHHTSRHPKRKYRKG